MKFTENEIKIAGLESLRYTLITEAKKMLTKMNENPLDGRLVFNLIELKNNYDEIERQLNILDPRRNEIPF